MRNAERRFLVWLILVLPVFCLVAGVTEAECAVGWELDLSDAKIVDSFADTLFHDKTANKKVQERYSVEVVDGVLRMTGDYGTDGANMGDYVQIFINFPGGIDLTKFHVFEVEWRTSAPKARGCLLVSPVSHTATGESTGSYYYADAGKTGEWSTSIHQYVPDAGFPTRGTPVKMTRVAVRAYAQGGATGEYALEIRSFKVRGFTDEEAAEREPLLSVYRDFKPAGVPEPWASEIFMFGPRGYCRLEGYESWYDNVVRCHGTTIANQFSQGPDWRGWKKLPPVEEYIEARRKELAAARPRGLYIQPILALAGEMKNRGPDGLAWAESYTRKLADAFKDEPYLASWFIADEVSSDWLWGVVAATSALNRADPSKLSIMNHFGIRQSECCHDGQIPDQARQARPLVNRPVVPGDGREVRLPALDLPARVRPLRLVAAGQGQGSPGLSLPHAGGAATDDAPGDCQRHQGDRVLHPQRSLSRGFRRDRESDTSGRSPRPGHQRCR